MDNLTSASRRRALAASLAILLLLTSGSAAAQQSVTDVLTFLLTNRSISTGDFVRDERAAGETRDLIARFLLLDLATVPVSSSAGGFTYRLDSTLGTVVRSSDSFGPFLTERSLTAGRRQLTLAFTYGTTTFDNLDGRDLRDGTLISTASILRGEAMPFDVETVALTIRTDTVTLLGNYGVTDRLDIGGALPYARVRLQGQRVDTYRGSPIVQATGTASAAGLGDIVLRAKYNVWRVGASGVAVAGEARLPTGNDADLLGAGRTTLTPRLIGSYERERLGLHGELGYSFRDASNSLGYAAAVTLVARPRLTLIGELTGLRFGGIGRLAETTEPHPSLLGVETLRLRGVDETTSRVLAIAGLKWNIADAWLVSASVRRPLTRSGLNTSWVPTVSIDYSVGR